MEVNGGGGVYTQYIIIISARDSFGRHKKSRFIFPPSSRLLFHRFATTTPPRLHYDGKLFKNFIGQIIIEREFSSVHKRSE